jgi:hypothetical protein
MKRQKRLRRKWNINRPVKFLTGIFSRSNDQAEYSGAMEQYKRYSKEYTDIAGHDNTYILR